MLTSMPDTRCPGCQHLVPAGRWCNRCGAPLTDVTAPIGSEGATSAWGPRVLAAVGVAATIGVVLWGVGRPWQSPGVTSQGLTSQEVDGAVVLAEDIPTSPSSSPTPPPAAPSVPPEERTNVVCSDLRPRSVPTADLVTNEPGELVELGDRTCVVMRAEGVTVP